MIERIGIITHAHILGITVAAFYFECERDTVSAGLLNKSMK